MHPVHLALAPCLLFATVSSPRAVAEDYPASTNKKPVKVFILAGQSNMQGKGFPEPMVWQLGQEQYRDRYTHLIQGGDYQAFLAKVAETRDADQPRESPTYLWSERKDVWINYLERRGNLRVGYGTPRDGFGPELNFGHVVGNHFDEQVLIIKTSWGGRAIAKGFMPPSAMHSDEEFSAMTKALNDKNRKWNEEEPARIDKYNARIAKENAKGGKAKRPRTFKAREIVTVEQFKANYGIDYRNMMQEVRDCLSELKVRFPGYAGQGYELSGFVWFQGWNDQYNEFWLSYEKNMAHFIRDVRRELDAPKLPFVIGQMGHGGKVEPIKEDSPRAYIKRAQAKVPTYPEFQGNVICVETDQYWDMEAHAIYTGPGGWSKDVDKWRHFGNDRGYHYYGSPWFFAQAGTGFGDAMIKLLK